MEFYLQTAIERMLETLCSFHELSRMSIWFRVDGAFRALWSFSLDPDLQKLLYSEINFPQNVLDNQVLFSIPEELAQMEPQNEGISIPTFSIITPSPYKDGGFLKTDLCKKHQNDKEQLLIFTKIAAELIFTTISDSKKWGLASETKSNFQINQQQTLQSIMNRFEEWRKKPKYDVWDSKGRSPFELKVKSFIEQGLPIPFVLPSFPFKSANTQNKVISSHVDMAEKLALDSIHRFCEDIRTIYSPGVAFVIVSDGRVYNSQLEIPLENVLQFQRELRQINESKHIHIVSLGDFLPITLEEEKRTGLIELFGQPLKKVEERINNDADFNRVYCGFKHFMLEELKFEEGISLKKKLRKCATMAREMMRSNDAYGRLIDCLFPKHIRLSIHPHSNMQKVGITLLPMDPSSNIQWGTPWHNCAVLRKSGQWELVRKNIALQRKYELQNKVELAFFIEREDPIVDNHVVEEGESISEVKETRRTVFVAPVPLDTPKSLVVELFSMAGKIIRFKYGRSKFYVFITFETTQEAQWAVQYLHGSSFAGSLLRVELSNESNKR